MSPRPKKKRRCQGPFCKRAFKPAGEPLHDLKKIPLYQDELEVLRLCDLEGLIQEEAGQRMGVSRGTVQRLLTAARKKTAQALTSGGALIFAREGEEDLEDEL
ncbi:DUF134 domain-containing protein [Desulfogranum mediterraneum]|uniref:DUF134 domain-containing protein n=1 Tax=Desulfogranum mediterraneum TaxID=160661 RepID=UPI0004071B98|nr:DUF134 domain-containing protein [Desulfogranum mediterraneum]